MNHLDIDKLRHELANLKAALGSAKALLPSMATGARLVELVILAEAKARTLVAQVDIAIDDATTEQGA